jgi:hypothetical protein
MLKASDAEIFSVIACQAFQGTKSLKRGFTCCTESQFTIHALGEEGTLRLKKKKVLPDVIRAVADQDLISRRISQK